MKTDAMPSQQTVPLTRRERFCRLYDFQPVDRPVRWEAVAFWWQTVDKWQREGTFPAGTDPMTHYRFDPRIGISGGLGFTNMSLSEPPVKDRVIQDDGDTQIIESDIGLVRRVRTDGGESMPTWLRFPVESHDDWVNKIKPRLNPADHNWENLSAEIAAAESGHDDPIGLYLVGLYAFWRSFWGEEKLAYAFYDFPATLHDMAETWLALHGQCTPRILQATYIDHVFFHEDMAFKNGPLIGPNLFSEFMAPYYRQLFAHLRSHGQTRFLLDSDGNNGKVLEQFIELGMNGLFPFEQAAGYDVIAFRREHPDFFIWGGIDKRVLLKTRDDIEREVMSKVPALWEGRGFIPSLDHSVMPCPQDNFEYYLELVRGLFEG